MVLIGVIQSHNADLFNEPLLCLMNYLKLNRIYMLRSDVLDCVRVLFIGILKKGKHIIGECDGEEMEDGNFLKCICGNKS